MTSKFGVIRKPSTIKLKREKKCWQDAVLKWIRSRPRIMVPEKGTDTWKNNCECCKKEVGYITEDGP
ncbi:hypothetical protein A2U01_0098555, partial [Trifolium medium]|nr:hypothetical protein [Trifolium medium]